ncbi:MAG: Hsp33 family molecular chaperone HslO [bacterium]
MKDYLVRAITTNKEIRALAVNSTKVVDAAQKSHNTTAVATAALGRTLTGALLMGLLIKSGEEISITINCTGPIKSIIAQANKYGEVRGYLANPQLQFKTNKDGKLDVAQAVGAGQLTVRKRFAVKEPYESTIPLISGEIGEDLTYYYTQSEQTPSAVGLGVLVNNDQTVKSSGGFLIQLLPDAQNKTIEKLEKNISGLKSISSLIDKGLTPEDLLEEVLQGFDFRVMARKDVYFKCKCSRERTKKLLYSLEQVELKDILEKKESVEIRCHFCGKEYEYQESEIREILSSD